MRQFVKAPSFSCCKQNFEWAHLGACAMQAVVGSNDMSIGHDKEVLVS